MKQNKTGYKEIVDFGEHIGYYIDQITKEKIATTWGLIHYDPEAKAYIIPAPPHPPS